jgi:hypothetical protein
MEFAQHIFVTVVALLAAGVVVWRIATAGKSESGTPSCDSCPTAQTLDKERHSAHDLGG